MADLDALDREHIAKFEAWRKARDEYTRLWRDASTANSNDVWLLKSLTERARAARFAMTRAEEEYRAAKKAVHDAMRAREQSPSSEQGP